MPKTTANICFVSILLFIASVTLFGFILPSLFSIGNIETIVTGLILIIVYIIAAIVMGVYIIDIIKERNKKL